HEHDGFFHFGVESREYVQNLFTGTRVEVSGWFVGQNQIRIGNDRARDRDTLFLTTRELLRLVMHAVTQADEIERGFNVLATLCFRQFRQQQWQFDILESSQHRHEVESLKDVTDVSVAPNGELALSHARQVRAHDLDLALSRTIDTGEQIQQRRLA